MLRSHLSLDTLTLASGVSVTCHWLQYCTTSVLIFCESVTESVKLGLVLGLMHFDDMGFEVVKARPTLRGRRAAYHATDPELVASGVFLMDGLHVSVEIIGGLKALSSCGQAYRACKMLAVVLAIHRIGFCLDKC